MAGMQMGSMGYQKREDTNVIRSIFRSTDNAMSKRKGTKRHQIVDKTLHQTNVWATRTTLNKQGASEGYEVPASPVAATSTIAISLKIALKHGSWNNDKNKEFGADS